MIIAYKIILMILLMNIDINHSCILLNNLLDKPPKLLNSGHICTTRQRLLVNRCSHQHIHVFEGQINARALADNPFALLSIENQVVGNKMHITIKSVNAGAYLCFNKKGRLVTRWVANLACVFTEEPTGSRAGHIKYRSVYNPDWFLGFNRKGEPMAGKIRSQIQLQEHQHQHRHHHQKHAKCYQFLKKEPQKSTPKPILDSSHEVLHKNDRNIAPINVRPKANGISDVINSRNSFRVTPKSVLRLMRTSSAPNSKQLIYSFSNNYNNYENNYNNNNLENHSTNSSIISHSKDIIPIDRLNA